jgi:acyl-CoA synthetase (AMP-forming)/AMP-acid ligase II
MATQMAMTRADARPAEVDFDTMTAADVLAGLPSRIHNIYEPFVRSMPDHPAFVEGDKAWSYLAFSDAVDAVAADLIKLGVRPGDRIMIASENCAAVGAFVLAASKLDAWAIVANPRLSPRELDLIYDHSGARRLFFTTAVSKEAADHAVRRGAETRWVGLFDQIGVGALNEAAEPEPVHADPAKQVAVLIYTSGTTGTPKGVMLTHQNLLFSAKVSAVLRGLGPNDRIYGVLPMSHIVGLTIILVASLMFGATVLVLPKYDPAHLADSLAQNAVSILYGVPATYQRLLAHSATSGKPLLSGDLRYALVAGAPLDLTLKKRVEQAFGLPLTNGFGITECSPGISGVRASDPREDDSVGQILPGVETRVLKPDGSPAAAGEVGELHVRGPNVMLGYYRAPDLTEKAVDKEGWFATGDLVRFDGPHLFVVGRAKEMIIRSGFNVYPAEVEAVLNSHPAVLQSAVVGRVVEANEEIVAFVQLVPGSGLAPGELEAFVNPQLTAYKRPSEIIVLDSFPAGSTGKILKHQLKERAQRAWPKLNSAEFQGGYCA